MMKILCVVGTRPEAIKMAPIVQSIAHRPDRCTGRLVATGQHRQLVDEVLALFGLRPDYDFDVMSHNQTPTRVAAAVLSALDDCIALERPDWVLVQGDTTTAMAAGLAAFYARTRVGHVEAGLRTYDKWQPFPEEINRALITTVADLHFAPTNEARANLLRAHVPDPAIVVTGNTVIDALKWTACQSHVADDGWTPSGPRLILLTAHRRENFGPGLLNICEAVRRICERYGDAVRIVLPVHPNPNVEPVVRQALSTIPQVRITTPLPYDAMVRLLSRAFLVLTDSGGLQEEAPGLGKPVLVLRDKTERPEGVTAGTVRLVGTDVARIVDCVQELWADPVMYQRMAHAVNPYGDGRAAERIVARLLGDQVEPWAPVLPSRTNWHH